MKDVVKVIKQKAMNWSAAGIVSTDPLSEDEKAELLKRQQQQQQQQ